MPEFPRTHWAIPGRVRGQSNLPLPVVPLQPPLPLWGDDEVEYVLQPSGEIDVIEVKFRDR